MIHLLHCPQMAKLAENIAAGHPDIQLGEVAWESFRDGFPNLRIESVKSLRNQDVAFLASLDTPAEIFRQLSVIFEIPRLVVRSLTIALPFYPVGTMERVDLEGQVATASSLARMLSLTPFTISGPAQVVIFDIHALQERFYFTDAVIPRLETAIPLLRERLRDDDEAAIAFPDEGAQKRFGGMFPERHMILCHKIRQGDKRVVTIQEGEPEGRHVVIVDDLVMTGGTLLRCAEALRDAGAERVSAYVTHGVFPENSWEKFLDADFYRFWLTDSCPKTVAAVAEKGPFEVLSLGGVIGEVLAT
ncbi:MAG: ribose-phosphate diphosphokinase [Desulfococcaceae bacterium]